MGASPKHGARLEITVTEHKSMQNSYATLSGNLLDCDAVQYWHCWHDTV